MSQLLDLILLLLLSSELCLGRSKYLLVELDDQVHGGAGGRPLVKEPKKVGAVGGSRALGPRPPVGGTRGGGGGKEEDPEDYFKFNSDEGEEVGLEAGNTYSLLAW